MKVRAFHEKTYRIYRYTLNSHLLILKSHIKKIICFLSSAEIFEAFSTNSVDPDQIAPVEAV